MFRLPHSLTMLLAGFVLAAPTPVPAADTEEAVAFARDIAPILEQACVRCHSPGNRKGEISLATFDDLRANDYVVAGDPDSSYLIDLVTAAGVQRPQMPKDGEPLSAERVALLRRWIDQGADWPDGFVIRERSKADSSWWSLQPLGGTVPGSRVDTNAEGQTIDRAAWAKNPIDRFVYAKLVENGLTPNPPADRRTLVRRATYDLTGLPPSDREVADFVADDAPDAYETLIDRLLDSPHYAERWGRHWLDVVRFGESNGYERNQIIDNAWPFRDFVIRSLNEDKPFDRFIREHLAGDVIGPDDPQVEVGSTFLVAGPYDDVGNQDAEQAAQIRADTIDEIIRATSEAFLGLTIGCARCHDHKFDPILQADYYGLYATFAGVRHGSRVVATADEQAAHAAKIQPLNQRRAELTGQRDALNNEVKDRADQRAAEHEQMWTREPVRRDGTEERFPPVEARFVRLVCEGQDINPNAATGFCIDEFEIWTAEPESRNVALASTGARARGASRKIEDFPGAYGPELAIDGRTGARFIAAGTDLTIELAEPALVDRVVFSSGRGETAIEHPKFVFVSDYRIEVSGDGQQWRPVADGRDRKPVNAAHRDKRLREMEITEDERSRLAMLEAELAAVNRQIAAIPPLPSIWVGTRVADDAKAPFHVFIGGSPQRPGDPVAPTSLAALDGVAPPFRLDGDAPESQRRQALADWIVHPDNPLTPRVLANRLWHYHFGIGIVDTPSDFGYMGGQPTHPQLLDWLARQVHRHGWRMKPLHRQIMTSQTYRQSSEYRADAARVDGDSRLLWRFPPRRLSAEEIRDTALTIAGQLDTTMGGPGFRLYRYLQDNVATYIPLDEHGPETYRRAVYHQNARAARTDLMTDFDQPDCAFSIPKRTETTTPLQALTMLNHNFTLDMAGFLAERIVREAGDAPKDQIARAYSLCYARQPSREETDACRQLIDQHGLPALCRVLLNTSELIYVE